ncbi:SH3 domain-containing protein (plasmid) [Coraliomargarita sp. W4R53]
MQLTSTRAIAIAMTVIVGLAVVVPSAAVAAPTALPAMIPTPTPKAPVAPPQATAFVSPLAAKSYTVTSYDGPRCMPLPGASTYHYGIDLGARGGEPIYAVAAGVVTATVTGTSSRAGYVAIRHYIGTQTYTSLYYHIWEATTHVKVGDTVRAGQRISQVGTSGGSTGNHLHLEIWTDTSSGAKVLRPTEFLLPRKVDLVKGATVVTAKATPATCTYYATTAVNLRSGPSTSYSTVTTLSSGTAVVHVPGSTSNSFLPVKVGSKSGWVASWLLTPTKPAPTPTPTPTPAPAATPAPAVKPATYVTTAALNLRSSASTTAKVVILLPKGANVGAVLATSGVWRKVAYVTSSKVTKTGWVHSGYLKTATSSAAVAAKPATYVTTAALNLRSSASTTAKVVVLLPKGANVGAVLATSGVWRKVSYVTSSKVTKTGWVHSGYLKKR